MAKGMERLNVNVNSETAAVLHEGRVLRDVSYTEQVRRSVALYDFLRLSVEDGSIIQVVRTDGTVRQVILIGENAPRG